MTKKHGFVSKSGNKSEDLILTIESDSEIENFVSESSSESDEQVQEQVKEKKVNKTNKKSRKKLDKEQKDVPEAEDLNPDFQFIAEDYGNDNNFDGWDFDVSSKDVKTEVEKKDVDLDGILKRKGGLVNLASFETESNGPESPQMSDSDSSTEDNVIDEADDDELALDGFGMGIKGGEEEEEEEELERHESEKEHDADNSDDSSSEADMDEEHPELRTEEITETSIDDEDSPEKLAEFYADEKESNKATSQIHKTFQSLQLSRPVLKGLGQLGYTKPSPIQSASIPIALLGKDIVAGAVTGSGKTAAYMIPIIERLLYKPSKISQTRVIILAPTRELAIQVFDVGKKLARFVNNLEFGLAVGGLNLRQQEQQLKSRPDVVIATPGRLIDHIRNSHSFSIDSLEVLVIDEADRMLEEGFQAELTEILSLVPKHKRQTLLFSATMNTKIQDLIQLSLQKPVRIMIDPPKAAASKLVQEFARIRKRDHLRPALLFEILKGISSQNRVVVFVARKESAHKLRIILGLLGMKVAELHGSLTQEQRLQSVNDFKNLVVPVLICTDLAARGLDIPKIEAVINYDMPKTHEIYLHRVGRTARAGREGRSISFVGESTQDRSIVKDSIKSLAEENNKGKALSHGVDWIKVEEIHKLIQAKESTIEEVLAEEKSEKEILQAEMELKKASNLIKHEKEIKSRPKRTWFESEKDKNKSEAMHHLTKHGKKVNSKKRKAMEVKKDVSGKIYKKTQGDRMKSQQKSLRPTGKVNRKIKGSRK